MTYQEGLEVAQKFGIENEYNACIDDGMTPEEVLRIWNLV